MKTLVKILFSILVLVACFSIPVVSSAQQTGVTYTLAQDTLNGNETVNFTALHLTTPLTVAIQANCSQVGGTSDGTLNVEVSVDGTYWETLVANNVFVFGLPNDTLTVVNNAVYEVVIKDCPWPYIRGTGTGTASDTTLVTWKYNLMEPFNR